MLMEQKRQVWCRRKRGTPCPVCGRQSWCTVSEDGVFVRCTKAPSDKPAPAKNGDMAWIHQSGVSVQDIELVQAAKEFKSVQEVTRMAMAAYCHRNACSARVKIAKRLGVSVRSVERLCVGYGEDRNGDRYTSWPSMNERAEIIGITRRYEDGSKKTAFGTQAGIFYSKDRSGLSSAPCLIVEGASDVAAAITIGLFAIGRPSNTGGADMIRRMGVDGVVLGERDFKPEKRGVYAWCPANCCGCSHCYPGLFGARSVSRQLGCRYVMPPDGCKDLREVLANARVKELLGLLHR